MLTGLIKANVPARIAFAVTSLIDSRVVLDMPGAERLLGRGDMLFMPPDAAKPQRIQGAFIEDSDVQNIVDHWHQVTPIPQYARGVAQSPLDAADGEDGGEDDPLMEQARGDRRAAGHGLGVDAATAAANRLQPRGAHHRTNGGRGADRPGGRNAGQTGALRDTKGTSNLVK